MNRRNVTISIDYPPDVEDSNLAGYIFDALGSWGGQLPII